VSADINSCASFAITLEANETLALETAHGVGALCPKSTIVRLRLTFVKVGAAHTITLPASIARAQEASDRIRAHCVVIAIV
jgi:hypothetical protein